MLFPEYTLSTTDDDSLSKWKLHCRKKEKLNELKHKLQNQSSDLKVQMKYYVSFPSNEAHDMVIQLVQMLFIHSSCVLENY